jgi:hypothetical protein
MTDHHRWFPLRLSREGTTRVVLVVGPLAVKFARGERGRRCNRFEARVYKCVDVRRRAMLCPVLWCTSRGRVLLMRATCPITEAEAAEFRARGFPDWDYMGPNDEECPFEPKASDWGWLNGRLVALDYSTPEL